MDLKMVSVSRVVTEERSLVLSVMIDREQSIINYDDSIATEIKHV